MALASLREAYGQALVAAGAKDKDIVVLDADLCKSTKSVFFEKAYPERFIETGIAEQNMTSMAAGLAIAGKKPFINTFAVFDTGRNYDQIRQSICIPKLKVTICGSSSGLSDFADGSTHQAIEDVTLMRVLPNMTVFVPADAVETAKVVETSLKIDGPVYIRVNRMELPVVTDASAEFITGKTYVIVNGKEYVIFANGVMLHKALEAAKIMEKDGVSVKVVNVPTVKPVDREAILAHTTGAKGVVVAEEHSRYGGLYSLISEILIEKANIKAKSVAIEDIFGTSSHSYDKLMDYYGLTTENIVNKLRSFE